ncbi:MAG: HDOD domain-containing protein [Bryobacteraceae bacterium]|jgi:HD-like signal output (HDOD) protein
MLNAHLADRAAKGQESYGALKGLPPFPAVVSRLLGLLANEDYEIKQLVELISADPMFASELLLATNSAKYGSGKEVTSLRHAAALLGRETLRSFAVAVSLRMYIGRVARQDQLAKVWRHSLATAVICDVLAECNPEIRKGSRDDAPYVAGLLHDIGSLGLMVAHPKEYAEVLGNAILNSKDLRELEQNAFQLDHCAAGHRIACAWKFSPTIAEVALRHHQEPSGGEFTLLELVKVGVLIADALGYEVVAPQQPRTVMELAELLPGAGRVRFASQIDMLPERIAGRIGSFEL